ncbi:MAG: PIG-L family deacetylase [Gemmatimonadaceae bacterium]
MRPAHVVAAAVLVPRMLAAQGAGAETLGSLARHLGVSARVLLIGAHPDDEDTQLISWLTRGRGVETAYLSLTRGEGGQNITGNELGDALGILRTEELLAARRIDGGRQYFTRAFDFGFSKTAAETFTHWPREDLLRQVVSVVRSFRPHVVVSMLSGTPRDGHGQHQVAGLIAREAYDAAGDTLRMPRSATLGFAPWAPAKFYRGAFFNPDGATLRINVGEFDPLLGRSYAEIAGESRSQHKSQAFGSLQRRGVRWSGLTLEHSRSAAARAAAESSIFGGVDTSWSRFRGAVAQGQMAYIDSLGRALRALREGLDLFLPHRAAPLLARVARALDTLALAVPHSADFDADGALLTGEQADLAAALEIARGRTDRALQHALGVAIEATVPREVFAREERASVAITIYNRGRDTLRLVRRAWDMGGLQRPVPAGPRAAKAVAPDSTFIDSLALTLPQITMPWWMLGGRGMMYTAAGPPAPEGAREVAASVLHTFEVAGTRFQTSTALVYRYADQVKGEINRPLAIAPAVAVRLDGGIQYARANTYFERTVRVTVSSALGTSQRVTVELTVPAGLTGDSLVRDIELPGAGSTATVVYRVRGRLPPGRHDMTAVARAGERTYNVGYVLVDYDHIRPRRMYVAPTSSIQAVDVRVPAGLTVAYIPGVADQGAAALQQLGVPVTILEPAELRTTDLRRFTTLVVGPRAYDASPELRASRDIVLAFARRGGTVVVQYGQYEMLQPGIMPYPITLARPADRVTDESAPVRFVRPTAAVLRAPNVLGAADFEGWVQERGLYMPREFDVRYSAPLELNDAGEPANRGAVLTASVGRGMYVYTTLSLFRQLPNGVPGAARLLINLVSMKRPA